LPVQELCVFLCEKFINIKHTNLKGNYELLEIEGFRSKQLYLRKVWAKERSKRVGAPPYRPVSSTTTLYRMPQKNGCQNQETPFKSCKESEMSSLWKVRDTEDPHDNCIQSRPNKAVCLSSSRDRAPGISYMVQPSTRFRFRLSQISSCVSLCAATSLCMHS